MLSVSGQTDHDPCTGGVIGRDRAPPGSRPVEVSFSHNDLLYATSFPTARFGLGAFAIALETLYQKVRILPASHGTHAGSCSYNVTNESQAMQVLS